MRALDDLAILLFRGLLWYWRKRTGKGPFVTDNNLLSKGEDK